MAADTEDAQLPVIASSNRFLDLEPYIGRVYHEDVMRWGSIMPWEFPQNGTKEQEEEFLRREFGEVECHVQGPRFLKQVWYSTAEWNFHVRVQAISSMWFQDNAKEVNDPKMKEHMLAKDAQVSTFFLAPDRNTYGDKLLGVVVKVIQWNLHRPNDQQPPDRSSTMDTTIIVSPSDEEAKPNSTIATAQHALMAPLQEPSAVVKPEHVASTPSQFKPAPRVFSAEQPPSDYTGYTYDNRNFSGGMYGTFDQRQQFSGKRGKPDKRNTSGGYRSAYHPPDQKYGPTPMGQYGSQSYGMSPAMGYVGPHMASRPPNQGPSPNALPTVPQGQAIPGGPPPPHAGYMPYSQPLFSGEHPQMPMNAPHFAGGHPANVYHQYGQGQPFGDRSNQQYFNGADGHPEYSSKKRRDSMSSRGDKSRGSNGRGRGRGSKGRNSIGNSNFDYDRSYHNRNPSSHFNESNGRESYAGRRFSVSQQKNLHGSWRPNTQDENAVPPLRNMYEQGPPLILQKSHGMGNPQHPESTLPGMSQQPFMAQNTATHPFGNYKDRTDEERLSSEYHCGRNFIGDKCTYAKKLAVFDVPGDIPLDTVKDVLSRQFGPIETAKRTTSQHTHFSNHPPMMLIEFKEATAARKCVQTRKWQYDGRNFFSFEVAKELWDNTHGRYAPWDDSGIQIAPANRELQPQPFAAQQMPTITDHGLSEATVQCDQAVSRPPDPTQPQAASELTSEVSTPTTSRPATPSKNKKKGNKKKKKQAELRKASLIPAQEASADKGLGAEASTDDVSHVAKAADVERVPQGKQVDAPIINGLAAVGTTTESSLKEQEVIQGPKATVKKDAPVMSVSKQSSSVPQQAEGTPQVAAAPSGTIDGKAEEDLQEDSFTTAGDGPDSVKDASILTDETVVLHERPADSQSSSEEMSVLRAASTKSADSSSRPKKEYKKAPIPQLSQAKSTMKLQEIDTGDVKTSSPQSRTVSGGSEIPSATYVTAPNTPLVPEPSQQSLAQKATAVKQKGPAKTESLSMFSKPKKSKKSRLVSKDVKPVYLEPPDDLKPRKTGRKDPQGESNTEAQPDLFPVADIPGKLAAPRIHETAFVAPTENDTPQSLDVATAATAASQVPERRSLIRKLTSSMQDFVLNSSTRSTAREIPAEAHVPIQASLDGDIDEKPVEAVVVAEEKEEVPVSVVSDPSKTAVGEAQMPQPETLTSEGGQGDLPSAPGAEHSDGQPITDGNEASTQAPEGKKKNKNKNKNKNRAARKKAEAEVLAMSHPAQANETQRPLVVVQSNAGDSAASNASFSTISTISTSSPSQPSPGGKDIAPARERSVTRADGVPIRRKHDRVQSGKTADVSTQDEEKAQPSSRQNQFSLHDNDDEPGAEAESDVVKAAKEKLRLFDEQEKQKKANKIAREDVK